MRALWAAHKKIGAVRKVVEEFWSRPNSHDPYNRDNAWAMHVALVHLMEILKRH